MYTYIHDSNLNQLHSRLLPYQRSYSYILHSKHIRLGCAWKVYSHNLHLSYFLPSLLSCPSFCLGNTYIQPNIGGSIPILPTNINNKLSDSMSFMYDTHVYVCLVPRESHHMVIGHSESHHMVIDNSESHHMVRYSSLLFSQIWGCGLLQSGSLISILEAILWVHEFCSAFKSFCYE